jgi:hypothetical protein
MSDDIFGSFNIERNVGFSVTFQNGFRVLARFDVTACCTNRFLFEATRELPDDSAYLLKCSDAEIQAFNPNGDQIDLHVPELKLGHLGKKEIGHEFSLSYAPEIAFFEVANVIRSIAVA